MAQFLSCGITVWVHNGNNKQWLFVLPKQWVGSVLESGATDWRYCHFPPTYEIPMVLRDTHSSTHFRETVSNSLWLCTRAVCVLLVFSSSFLLVVHARFVSVFRSCVQFLSTIMVEHIVAVVKQYERLQEMHTAPMLSYGRRLLCMDGAPNRIFSCPYLLIWRSPLNSWTMWVWFSGGSCVTTVGGIWSGRQIKVIHNYLGCNVGRGVMGLTSYNTDFG
jgi:hypothetical protein